MHYGLVNGEEINIPASKKTKNENPTQQNELNIGEFTSEAIKTISISGHFVINP